jgi:broad specificity phosphatase PhoE
MASTWLFLRHGESTANAARRLSGWHDVDLTPRGETQARSAGVELAAWPLERVLSSDLQRARRTAELSLLSWSSGRPEKTPQLQIYTEFRERNLGEFQGRELDGLRASGEADLLLGWDSCPPQGESHADLAARALPILARLPELSGPTLLVAHGGLLRTLLGLLDDIALAEIGPRKVANAKVIERQLNSGRWAELAAEHGSQP